MWRPQSTWKHAGFSELRSIKYMTVISTHTHIPGSQYCLNARHAKVAVLKIKGVSINGVANVNSYQFLWSRDQLEF